MSAKLSATTCSRWRPLLDVAKKQAGCGSFLMISSDKAVNPTNVMGCTKRVCELIMAAKPGSRMRRVSVRFGNVLGSQGSVIPVLQEQIRSKQRVTVTHPDITRFFMTIPEAVSLVLQAFTVGKDGEILIIEMGRPIRIVELARTLIRLCGKSEDDIEIVFTGLRAGEKLHEELFYDSEAGLTTECEKVMRTSGSIIACGCWIYSGVFPRAREKSCQPTRLEGFLRPWLGFCVAVRPAHPLQPGFRATRWAALERA